MKHLPIYPLTLLFILLITVSCQKNQEVICKAQLELDIPVSFNMQLTEVNSNSGWITIDNSNYEGELMITIGNKGYISSIKVRGEIAKHLEKTYLVNTFGDVKNYQLHGVSDVKKIPIDCFFNCMTGQPLNAWVIAFCLAACGLRQ